jgi:HNH endonuclease
MKYNNDRELNDSELQDLDLPELLNLVDVIGSKRYHKLTIQDLQNYKQYDDWRYIHSNAELGSTMESKEWVYRNSTPSCPICGDLYRFRGGRNIDHKLPRSQYPWLSLDFNNLWVICYECNFEKAEMHWYEYERYIFKNYPNRYHIVCDERPDKLLKSLVVNKTQDKNDNTNLE